MLLHGGSGGHAVEELDLGTVLIDDELAAALVVPGEHTSRHDEIPPTPESLGKVPGAGAAAVRDDVAAEPVGGGRFRP